MPGRSELLHAYREQQMSTVRYAAPKRVIDIAHAPLVRYVEGYGQDFADLSTQEIGMFVAAKNCTRLIFELNNTPLADSSLIDDEKQLSSDNAPDDSDGIAGSLLDRPFFLPTDRFEPAPVTSISQFRDLLPHQHVLDEDVFWDKFSRGELLRREWMYAGDQVSDDDSITHASNYTEQAGAEIDRTQRASVLLDVSFSMGNNDRRGLVGRGLALAFTHRAHLLNADLHYAAFRTHLIDETAGKGFDTLQNITRNIMDVSNAGMTNIQRALNSRSDSILTGGSYKYDDLLLISDGLSKLEKQPPESVALHTFVLGDLKERDHGQFEMLEQSKQLATLREWSTTFNHLDEIPALLRISSEDLHDIAELVSEIGEQIKQTVSEEEIEKLHRILKNLTITLEHYGPVETEQNAEALSQIRALLKTHCEMIDAKGARAIAQQNKDNQDPPQARAQESVPDARQTGSTDSRIASENADDPDLSFGGRWGATQMTRFPNPFKVFVRLARATVRKARQLRDWLQNG